ncbi:MAG: PAS domain S-box protein [Nitrospiria bacterium]
MDKYTGNNIPDQFQTEVPLEDTDLLRAITEVTSDHIYVKSLDGNFLMINSSAAQFLGKPPEEVLGKGDSEFFPPEIVTKIRDHDFEIINSGVSQTYEETIEVSGMIRTFLSVKALIRDRNQNVIGLVGISRDITDRKVMEEKLRTEHAFRKPIEDSMLAGVVAVDLEQRLIYVNPSFCNMVGWNAEELIGTSPPYPFWPSDEIETITKVLKDRLNRNGPREIEFRFRRKNGENFQVLSLGSPLSDGHGKMIGILSTFHDITDRKRIEDELKLQSEIIKNMASGVLLIRSSDGVIVHTSPRINEMFGYEPNELIGKHISTLIAPGEISPKEAAMKRSTFLEENKAWSGETKNIRKDGSILWTFGNMSTLIHPLYGKVWVNVKHDITEKRKMEEELLKVQKLESLGILAGGIAHDFNNILTGILGNISLAKIGMNPASANFQRLDEAEKATDRAAQLARQLLTFAKGGTPIKKTSPILEVLENAVKFSLRGSNILCDFSFQKDLWPIDFDEGQISQVIQNISINAQQAMVAGGTIQVKAINRVIEENKVEGPFIRKGNYVEISIQDQGVGIPQEILSKIFDPYFTTKEKGSGLGLAISHSIIQRHDGVISVKSQLGRGTTFFIFLPASTRRLVQRDAVKNELVRGTGRVLIMDDEESVLNAAGAMLRYLGYEVEIALSGSIADEIFKISKEIGNPFDLVISDLTVPGDIGGIELLKRLKEIEPKVKVIVTSGYSNDPAIANFQSYGFADFILKPYRIFDISKAIKKALEK